MCSNVGSKGIHPTTVVYYVTFGIITSVLLTSGVRPLPLSDFFPFNASAGDSQTETTDDGGSGGITINPPFNFFNRGHDTVFLVRHEITSRYKCQAANNTFIHRKLIVLGITFPETSVPRGRERFGSKLREDLLNSLSTDCKTGTNNQLIVNNNGIISFLAELKKYRPIDFPLDSDTPVIAPFWADVDVSVGGEVWFRQSRQKDILEKATNEIRKYFPVLRKFRASWVFVSTWDNVGFYGAVDQGKTKRNTFQAVLITDSVQSFVIFNYNKIQWTTGSNSGGQTSTGLGGNPAQAGFNAGDKIHYQEIPGARKDAVLNLTLTSNVDVPGKWVFRVDSAKIQGSCSTSGEKIKGYGNLIVVPSSGVVLGGEKIILYGPCYYKEDRLLARYDELNVTFPCHYGSKDHAVCVTPTVFRVGPLSLSLSIDNGGWNYTGSFTTVNIAQSNTRVIRRNPKKWLVDRNVSISWPSYLIPSNTSTVELLEYREVNGVPSLRRVLNFTDVVPSSQFHFKLQNISTSAIIRVTAQDNISNGSAVSFWSDVFPSRWPTGENSAEWCGQWLKREFESKVNLTQREPCPCTRAQADRDTGRYQPDPFCNRRSKVATERSCLYRGGATDCIMLNYQGSSEGSQLCCYGADGELLHARDGNGGGTLGRYHYRSQSDNAVAFFSYFNQDVLPNLHCCQYSNKNRLCLDFLKYRPAVTCDGYDPPAAAQAAGDPHLTTLDGRKYTFNGEGEFVLMEDSNSTVVVQVRAARAKDIEGKLQNATLFTAVAMAVTNKSDTLEVRLDEEDIVQFLVNGQPRELASSTSELEGLTVIRSPTTNSTTAEVTVVMGTSGISVFILANADLLNIMLMVGNDKMTGNLQGLLGNYNGNASDDLLSRNGTLLVNATMREIHYDFGMSWKVNGSESIMTAPVPSSLETEESETPFQPLIVDIAEEDLRNGTEEVCGSNQECIFDYVVTGNENIAKSTKDFNQRYEDTVKAIQPVVRCPYLDPPQDGNRSLSGLSNGSKARYVCDNGFILLGAAVLTCRSDGSWDNTQPRCVIPLPQSRSQNELYYIGAGIGGGVILLVIIVTLIIHRCRPRSCSKKPKKDDSLSEEEPPIELPTIFFPPRPDIPNTTTVFKNELFLQSLRKLADTGSFRIPRPTYVDPNIYEEYFF